ncbi:MAG: 6-bladed beta-propeller [Gemmatimonadota bacterium]|nr:6-bladed beta-propeller [Gemmatimonadota bacterium]
MSEPVKTLRLFAAATLFAVALPIPTQSLPAQEVIYLAGRDQRLDADFEEVFRIGVLEGEEWEMFGTVMHVAFDENGNLYIVDGSGGMSLGDGTRVFGLGSSGTRVLVFDASGNFLREFGTSGEGPGEFNMPAGFAVMRDGTTIVSDFGHRAYQLFDTGGRFLRMVQGNEGGGPGGMARDLLADPRGGAAFTGGFERGIAMIGDAGPPTSRPITRLGLAGEEVQTDTVVQAWLPPRAEAGLELPGNISIPGGARATLANALSGLSQPSIFEPPLLAGVLPNGGIVYSDSSAYALKVTRPDAGDVARIIRRPIQPEPVTPRIEREHREKQEREEQEAARSGGSGGAIQIRLFTPSGRDPGALNPTIPLDMPEPTYYPELSVLRDLSTTWDGSIWVRRRGDEPESDGPIDVVTADGRYVGTFAIDATEMPDAFGPNGMAAFIELDEFEVARVVVRRLPAAVR